MKRRTLFLPAVLVAALACPTMTSAVQAQSLLNKPAPDFTLPLVTGGEGSLSQLKGKVVLVNFFASW